jgi:hypothetical protein
VRGHVFCTLGAQKPTSQGLAPRKKMRKHQKKKRYETGRPYSNFGRLRSLCGPPTPPHGHICPRQRLVHLRVDVEGRYERLYRPRPRTWDRTTAVSTSDLRKYPEIRPSIKQRRALVPNTARVSTDVAPRTSAAAYCSPTSESRPRNTSGCVAGPNLHPEHTRVVILERRQGLDGTLCAGHELGHG